MKRPYWTTHKPYFLMYPPKKWWAFQRQGLNNWLDVHTHEVEPYEKYLGRYKHFCYYCNRTGDDLWWKLPTCRAHNWHIKNIFKPGGAGCFGCPPTEANPYRRK